MSRPRSGGRARFENCQAGVERTEFGALAGTARGGGAISIRVGAGAAFEDVVNDDRKLAESTF